MQNKANFRQDEVNVTSVLIKGYINIPLHDSFKNKPNSNPIEPNRQKTKMSLTFYYTRDYEKKQRFYTAENKAELQNEYNLLLNKGLREFMYIAASKTNPSKANQIQFNKSQNDIYFRFPQQILNSNNCLKTLKVSLTSIENMCRNFTEKNRIPFLNKNVKMTVAQVEKPAAIADLAELAFASFCSRLKDNFNLEIESASGEKIALQNLQELNSHFNTLNAVTPFQAQGALQGDLYLIFDNEALFTLAGLISNTPQKQITKNIESASIKNADVHYDAIAEAANWLIAAWDNTSRSKLNKYIGFQKKNTKLHKNWTNAQKFLQLEDNRQFVLFPCQIKTKTSAPLELAILAEKSLSEKIIQTEDGKSSQTEENPNSDNHIPQSASGGEKNNQMTEDPAKKKNMKKNNEMTEDQPKKNKKNNTKKKPDKEKENTTDTSTKAQQQNQSKQQPQGKVSKAIKQMTHPPDNKNTESKSKKNNTPKSSSQLTAKDIMQTDFPWATTEDTVQQLLNKMQQFDIEYVLIGQNHVPTGIVSKTDLNSAISPYLRDIFSKWKRPLDDASLKIKCKWIMTSPIHTITPHFTLNKLLTHMSQYRLKCLPVVDIQGNALGLVTAFNIFEAILKQNTPEPGPNPSLPTP